jgi:hypothetical protein
MDGTGVGVCGEMWFVYTCVCCMYDSELLIL